MISDNIYIIREGSKNDINSREIVTSSFDYLLERDEVFVRKLLEENQIIKSIKFPEIIISTAMDIIVNDKDINILYELLEMNGVPLYSLIISPIMACKKKYLEYRKIDTAMQIVIICTKNNIVSALELSKKLNKKITIDGRNISLKDYKNILSNYDMKSLENIDLEILYQNQSSAISTKELYQTACIIDNISRKIEKHNLSPLEKIIYAYDIAKNKVYEECQDNKDNPRDLNKVLQSGYAVCVGHSNMFNAILKNLGINALPLISTKTKHQRSLVYINDKKYNIDGAYAFDVTGDSRKNNEYINNYNYFGVIPSNSEKDCPSDNYNIINVSMEELLQIYNPRENNQNTNNDKVNDKEYLMEKAFLFIDETEYDTMVSKIKAYLTIGTRERQIIRETCNRYNKKYHPKEIHSKILLSAIYTVRKKQKENCLICNINIDEIYEALKTRLINQSIRYTKTNDKYEKLYHTLEVLATFEEEVSKEYEDIITIEKGCQSKILKKYKNN